MEENMTVSQWIVGSLLLLLILYGLWNGVAWLFVEMVDLTPGKLAVFSLCVIFIPFVLTIVLLAGTANAGNSTVAYFTMFIMPFGVLGLVISGVWKLIS